MNGDNKSNQIGSNQQKSLKADAHTDSHSPETGLDEHPVAGSRSQNVESFNDMKEDLKAGEENDS
ncbi:hypothetical protein [Rufibacter immobilis]|uniref:hypothetical protein n=1 Tax=Rufibacter immobilis TaxID=1348778 RepID=UPI0035EAC9A4